VVEVDHSRLSITNDDASNVTICSSLLPTSPVLSFAVGLPPHIVSTHIMHIMISLLLAGESTLYVATSLLNLKRQLIAGVAYVHSTACSVCKPSLYMSAIYRCRYCIYAKCGLQHLLAVNVHISNIQLQYVRCRA